MASELSIALRCEAALERIEATIAGLGVEVQPAPRVHRDKAMLRVLQLESIANQLETLPRKRQRRTKAS